MLRTALKLSRSIVAAAVVLATFAVASSARAGTMLFPQLYPKAFISGVTATYKVETIDGQKVGHFSAAGNLDYYMTSDTTTVTSSGTFGANLYFTSTGGSLGSQSGTELFVKNAASQNLFYSTQAYVNNPYSNGTALKLETLWAKPAGATSGLLASASSYPLVGSYVYLPSVTFSTGVTGFAFSTTNVYTDDVLFTTNNSSGTANVYMVPTPAAIGGGLALFGAISLRRKGRREA